MIPYWKLGLKLAIMHSFYDHVLTKRFLQYFIFCLTTRASTVCKYLKICFKDFKRRLHRQIGRQKIVRTLLWYRIIQNT